MRKFYLLETPVSILMKVNYLDKFVCLELFNISQRTQQHLKKL